MGVRLLPALFAAAFGFSFLSAALAESLGLGRARILLFTALVLALLAASLFAGPPLLRRPRHLPLFLLLLLVLLAWWHVGRPFDPLDYKILLPLLVLLLLPELARALAGLDVARLVWMLLLLYVLASGAALALLEPSVLVRGYEAIRRWDVTGSMVSHSSLLLLFLLLSAARLAREPISPLALLAWSAVLLALAMIFLAATRTTVAILVLFVLLDLIAGPGDRIRFWIRALIPAALAFALATLLVSDVMWRRLVGLGLEEYTSGRLASWSYWFALAVRHPLGLGIGYVRQELAAERPWLDGGVPLEWPHNELLRFWVEGGWAGLVLIVLLMLALVKMALYAARNAARADERALALGLAADMLARSLLQNYFNEIYQATMAVLVIGLLAYRGLVSGEQPRQPGVAGAAGVAQR